MNNDDALTITNMVANHWPSSQWNHDTLAAYAKGISWMDPAIATAAVLRAVQTFEHYPRVSQLRELYGIEKRMAEPDTPIERMLNDTPTQIMPQWIGGWIVARVRHNDQRVFPEQSQFLDGEPMPHDARDAYIQEAVGLPIADLFRKMTAEML